jgi:hypothetical protein
MNPERLWASNGFSRYQPRRRSPVPVVLAWIGALTVLALVASLLP